MNIRLLKLASKDRKGCYRWAVPGYSNVIVYTPERLSFRGWGPALRWPCLDRGQEISRAACLDRHRKLVKREIRQLLSSV